MKDLFNNLRPALARTSGLALVLALAVSFNGLTHADTFYQLTVNVSGVCGPINQAQVTIVNGPDDGAFGLTNSAGTYTFTSLRAGVFYLHIAANGYNSEDTDTIVLNSNQSVDVTLYRLATISRPGDCTPPPGGGGLSLTVNVSDACGPVNQAQVTIVNGPDDGAFGLTNSQGTFTFTNLSSGVFYLRIAAADHVSKDSGAIFLIADTSLSFSLDRTNGDCGPPPGPGPTPGPGPSPTPCVENAAVSLSGPATLNPGQTGTFNAHVVNNGETWWYHGSYFQFVQKTSFSISPSYGHYSPGMHTNDTRDFSFILTAPTAPGTYTLRMQNIHRATADYQRDNGTVCAPAPNSDVFFGQEGAATFTVPAAPGPTNHAPIGWLDGANCDIIGGWAADLDTPNDGIAVHLYYTTGSNTTQTFLTDVWPNTPRPDVNSALGISGTHGFTITTPQVLKDGNPHMIYAYGIDSDPSHALNAQLNGSPKNLGPCGVPGPTNHAPIGTLDGADCSTINGWAADLDTPNDGIPVHIYYTTGSSTAQIFLTDVWPNTQRDDVNSHLGITGVHGFTIPTPQILKDANSHTVYVYAIDSESGHPLNAQLTGSPKTFGPCVVTQAGTISMAKSVRNVTQGQSVFTNSISANPSDTVEFQIPVTAQNGAVNNVSVSDSLPSRLIYVNNSLTVDGSSAGNSLLSINLGNLTANQTKTILFRATVADASQFFAGNTLLTNTANGSSSANTASASASVTVGVSEGVNQHPFGNFDDANCSVIGGWAVDPDESSRAIVVDIYANGPIGSGTKIATLATNTQRNDVNNQLHITGVHGFTVVMPQAYKDNASHGFWVYAQDSTTGSDVLIGSRTFNSTTCGTQQAPIGNLDDANCSVIGGWAYDPDESSKSVAIELYANGPVGSGTQIFSGPTTGLRQDVNNQLGITGNHGFTIFMPVALKDGNSHTIFAYALDSTTAVRTLFGNRAFNSATCITAAGSVSMSKAVRNVTQGQGIFTNSISANPGDNVEFQIQVTAQNGAVSNVLVSDSLPGKLSYANGTLRIDGQQQNNDNYSNVNLGNLTANQTKTILFRATVADASQFFAGNTLLTNTANGSSSANATSASASVTVGVAQTQAVLGLSKTVRNVSQGQNTFIESVSANPGDQIQFQIQVTNSGSTTAQNVTVYDVPSTFFTLTSGSATTTIGSLAAQATQTITLSATMSSDNSFSCGNNTVFNTATAQANNSNFPSDSATMFVNRAANCGGNSSISISKTVRNVSQGQGSFTESISANPGDSVQFQIQVSVSGNQAAQNVNVTDNLPGNMSLVSGSTSFNLGTINAGNSQTVSFTASLAGSSSFCNSATLTNTAFVNSSNAGSNSDSASVFVNGSGVCVQSNQASLSLTKEVRNVSTSSGFTSFISANNGDLVQFRLTVRNTSSNATANNVRLTDFLPSGLTYIPGTFSSDGQATGSLFGGTEFLGSMFAGQTRTITFNASVNTSINQNLINNANASADNASSVSAAATVSVSGSVLGGNIALTQSKRAFNQTRNVDATIITAQPGDIIVYTLSVTNQGNAPSTNYVFQDDIFDVLQLSQLQDFSDGTFNLGNLSLSWPAVTINSGATVTKTFTVKVNSSFAIGTDNVMTNTFGNTVNVQVNKPAVAGAFVAPKTGPTTNLTLLFAFLTVGIFAARKQKAQIKQMVQKLKGLMA